MTWSLKNANSLILLMLCTLLMFPGKTMADSAKTGPVMQFEQEHLDLGKIQQGKTPKGYFKLLNIGDEPLIINEIKASCGCTAAIVDKKQIAPGEKGKIEITVDTTGKELDIEKTITVKSNDSLRPEIILTLSLIVEPVEHPDFDMGISLFSDRCKSCHVDAGKGLLGKKLYQAICYQCHGKNGEGASASALTTAQYLKDHDDNYIYKWIAEGARGTGMAGYAKEKGGFLSKEEIDSLVNFIRQGMD